MCSSDLGGLPDVRRAFMERAAEWQWWNTDSKTVLEQWPVSIVTLHPEDRFEPGYSKEGISIRIRVRRKWIEGWNLEKSAPISCREIKVNGIPVTMEHVEKMTEKGLLEDSYEIVRLPVATKDQVFVATFCEKTEEEPRLFERRMRI